MTLPEWPEGTVALLSTAGEAPHTIPVSTAMRSADGEAIVLGLGAGRESLARLRADPRVAVTVLAFRDVAFTAHGTAAVVSEDAAGVVAVRVTVESVQDHMQSNFKIQAGVDWQWTDNDAGLRDTAVRAALRALL
jgi:Pyridoxamine 5'-phosphate oxidase